MFSAVRALQLVGRLNLVRFRGAKANLSVESFDRCVSDIDLRISPQRAKKLAAVRSPIRQLVIVSVITPDVLVRNFVSPT